MPFPMGTLQQQVIWSTVCSLLPDFFQVLQLLLSHNRQTVCQKMIERLSGKMQDILQGANIHHNNITGSILKCLSKRAVREEKSWFTYCDRYGLLMATVSSNKTVADPDPHVDWQYSCQCTKSSHMANMEGKVIVHLLPSPQWPLLPTWLKRPEIVFSNVL